MTIPTLFVVRGYREPGAVADVDLAGAPDPAAAHELAAELRAGGFACAYVAGRRSSTRP